MWTDAAHQSSRPPHGATVVEGTLQKQAIFFGLNRMNPSKQTFAASGA